MPLLLLPCPDAASHPARPRPHDPTQGLRNTLEAATAAAFGVSPRALRASTRGTADIAFARQSAMYLAHVALGLSYNRAGRLFRRDRSTAAHACHVVEDRRDDPDIDRRLALLECWCAETFGAAARPLPAGAVPCALTGAPA